MQRWLRTVSVLLMAFVLLVAVPVATTADEHEEEFRINLLAGDPTEAPANTPFFILHGWGPPPAMTNAIGQMGFGLDIDGVDQGKGKFLNGGAGGSGTLVRLWSFEYADGLPEGTYVFTGTWTLPCSEAVEGEFIPGPCDLPNEPVAALVLSLTVTFG